MDVREKLVELIKRAKHSWSISTMIPYDCTFESWIADHLIAHGVTVQEWISVKDRLPKPGEYVLVCDTREDWYGLWEFSGVAWYDASYQPWSIDEVTHWKYLPQPPKGE